MLPLKGDIQQQVKTASVSCKADGAVFFVMGAADTNGAIGRHGEQMTTLVVGASGKLRVDVGQGDKAIEWVVVRPDTLTIEDRVTEYEVHPSPTRSAIFNAGRTGRINIGDFMADLITDNDTWNRWKGQMPVIYNKTSRNEQIAPNGILVS